MVSYSFVALSKVDKGRVGEDCHSHEDEEQSQFLKVSL